MLVGVAGGCLIVCAWALLTKVFPSLASEETYARLREPFAYWNSVGLMAALGVRRCCGSPRGAPATRPPTRSHGPGSACCWCA